MSEYSQDFSSLPLPSTLNAFKPSQMLPKKFKPLFPHILLLKLTLYFVSRLPATFPLSMLEDPPEVNSTPVSVLVFTCRIWWWGWGLGLREIIDTSSNCYLKFEKTKMVALAKNIWGLLAQISVLWRAHCCSRVLQGGRTVMERSWSTLIGLVCREHSAKK